MCRGLSVGVRVVCVVCVAGCVGVLVRGGGGGGGRDVRGVARAAHYHSVAIMWKRPAVLFG